jgi:type IV pilus assembly protein PilY1
MNRKLFPILIFAIIAAGFAPAVAPAAPDQFVGDTAIYGGQPTVLQPNVLIIIDSSGSMGSPPPSSGTTNNVPYTPGPPYFTQTPNCFDSSGMIGNCNPTNVYDASQNFFIASTSSITTSCFGGNPQDSLQTSGFYNGYRLNADGSCCTRTRRSGGTTNCGTGQYQMGNYINWIYDYDQSNSLSKIDIAKSVIGQLVLNTSGVKFGIMDYRYSGGPRGGTFLDGSVASATYQTTINDMDAIFTGSHTNRQALVQVLNTAISPSGNTPLGVALFEAMRYFQGGATVSGATIGITGGNYTSPIEFGCQKNYVIVITDGMSNADSVAQTAMTPAIYNTYGSWDGTAGSTYANNVDHSVAGVAKYLYQTDLRSDITGTQNVTTFTIGFGLSSTDAMELEGINLLKTAADSSHGHGQYYAASSAQTLSRALTAVISEIFSVNTSFVAPVVPVNPQNNVYSGQRVYMGFFKPEDSSDWAGNIKKFGLGIYTSGTGTVYYNQVLDSESHLATYVDNDGNGYDDRDGLRLPSGTTNGAFRSTVPNVAKSFWSTTSDGGDVMAGGVGGNLMTRDNAISCSTCNITGTKPRNIYTYLGNTALTNSTNAFSASNTGITATVLGLPGAIISTGTTTDVKQLVNYVHGFDVYDDNSNGNVTEKRSWILGDILHSKPQVVSYATYSFDATNEANCSNNKTMIYVGSNDGMLHAFKDCDGSEAWAFIPPDLLTSLQYLRDTTHTYFVDSSVQSYVYDANQNGTIDSGDKVVLIIGLRRGGGLKTSPTTGYYYALDVTNPAAPTYLWKISNASAGLSDMGEAWSDPKLAKILVGSTSKIAMFIGGGYDNCNEDSRFGSTQTFTGSCVSTTATSDGGLDGSNNPITSSGAALVSSLTSTNYKGRAVYAVEVASLDSSGVPSFTNSGTKIWGHTLASTPALEFSMVSDTALVDTNYDGYVDRLYMGDAGGNIWRFDISDTNTGNWSAAKIFNANPGYTNGVLDNSKGRKIFFRPSVVVEGRAVTNASSGIYRKAMTRLYFGTGDREHPLNRAVVDRFYEVLDKGQMSPVTELKLVDVTEDIIQAGTTAQVTVENTKLTDKEDPANTTYYGWYIRLDSGDRSTQVLCNGVPCPGEKVLASPTVYNGVVYFTTYSPNTQIAADPCQLGNLGSGLVYAVDYWSGRAVINFDLTNDNRYSSFRTNPFATISGDSRAVLLRSDRHGELAGGIPSNVVTPPGQPPLIGCGGGLCNTASPPGPPVRNIYWRPY